MHCGDKSGLKPPKRKLSDYDDYESLAERVGKVLPKAKDKKSKKRIKLGVFDKAFLKELRAEQNRISDLESLIENRFGIKPLRKQGEPFDWSDHARALKDIEKIYLEKVYKPYQHPTFWDKLVIAYKYLVINLQERGKNKQLKEELNKILDKYETP